MSLIPQGTTVTVETKWFPPLTVDLAGASRGEPSLVIRTLKPKITLRIQDQVIAKVAPAGEPVPNQWPKVKIGLMVAAALMAFTVLRIIK